MSVAVRAANERRREVAKGIGVAPQAMLRAALGYLAMGWSVLPIQVHGKRPIVAWRQFEERAASESAVRAWFEGRKPHNVGIVTGAVSAIVVIDVDVSHGGTESLERLIGEHGALPPTVEANTGGGGRHLYFAYPARRVPSRVGIAPGIDVRADGGCVVAPPSLHPSGERYRWRARCAPGEITLAALPPWLEQMLRASSRGHPVAQWRELTRRGVREGSRNNTIAALAGHLLHFGVDPEVALELMLAWNRVRCEPPLADAEVVAVVASITRLHERSANG